MSRLSDGLNDVVCQYIDRPILLVDGDSTEVAAINQAGFSFFKITSDLAGVFWPGILTLANTPTDIDLRHLWLIKEGGSLQSEMQRVEKLEFIDREDGTEKHLELRIIKPINNTNQWIVIVIDKTDVEMAVRSRSDFVTLASHQLRTPLAGIKWNIELYLQRYRAELSEQQLHILTNADQSVDRMNELIRALLQLSRIETGSLKLKPRPVEVHKLLQDVIKAQSQPAKRRDIALITSFHKSLPEVYLDGTLVGYVFENLISNAIKYSHEHSEVIIFLSKLENTLLLQVTDSGIGIPHDHQKMIFQKFYRDPAASNHDPDGTGLGLHLCRIIAHRSGGDIWFKSEQGKGSTFWFSIPLKGVTVAADGPETPLPSTSS